MFLCRNGIASGNRSGTRRSREMEESDGAPGETEQKQRGCFTRLMKHPRLAVYSFHSPPPPPPPPPPPSSSSSSSSSGCCSSGRFCCYGVSARLEKILRRIRSKLRKKMKQMRMPHDTGPSLSNSFRYDALSYAMNFDEGSYFHSNVFSSTLPSYASSSAHPASSSSTTEGGSLCVNLAERGVDPHSCHDSSPASSSLSSSISSSSSSASLPLEPENGFLWQRSKICCADQRSSYIAMVKMIIDTKNEAWLDDLHVIRQVFGATNWNHLTETSPLIFLQIVQWLVHEIQDNLLGSLIRT